MTGQPGIIFPHVRPSRLTPWSPPLWCRHGAYVWLLHGAHPPGLVWNFSQHGGRPREWVGQESEAFLGSSFRSCRAPIVLCAWRESERSAQLGSRWGAQEPHLSVGGAARSHCEMKVLSWPICRIRSTTLSSSSFAKGHLHLSQLHIASLCSPGLFLVPATSILQLSLTLFSADPEPSHPFEPAQSSGCQEQPRREKQKCFSVIFMPCCVSIVGKFKRLSYN